TPLSLSLSLSFNLLHHAPGARVLFTIRSPSCLLTVQHSTHLNYLPILSTGELSVDSLLSCPRLSLNRELPNSVTSPISIAFSLPPVSSPFVASVLSSPAQRSARSTFPDLVNFRVARLNGFRRVFAHVAPVFFERGIAKPETKEISSLSVEPCEWETLIVTVFEIDKSEIPAFMERELEFRFLAVMPQTLDCKPFDSPAVLCARYSDEEFFQIRCKGSKEIYFQHYGRFNIHKIWRDDILPCRTYLRHCVLAAKNLGSVAHDNFLDHTFLGDRKTTIHEYLATTGAGIMEEEPPESLKTRYGG
ncbi:uncharacterized protein LOC110631441, partial [Hevea brasiliensis]|uniref:uncharacterized protein LOC110631441 n=1 Tax=Hevea brasiliensis TaxID=3981 RepID=UPI0025DA1A5C